MAYEEPHVIVTDGKALKDGGCNACSKFVSPSGQIEHDVLTIFLNRCSVRVCPECAQELLKKLAIRVNQVCEVDLTVVIPDHEHEGDEHPGKIKPGVYHLTQLVELMREHKRDPKVIQFLADMMEP